MEANLKIADVKEVQSTPDGSAVVIKAEAVVGGQRSEVEIAITRDLAAQVAVALLATTAKQRAERDKLEPALEVLAAAVVASGCADKVRMHLLFEKGVVLPLEVNVEAATALHTGLTEELGANANSGLAHSGQ
jgi:hypothetical protein